MFFALIWRNQHEIMCQSLPRKSGSFVSLGSLHFEALLKLVLSALAITYLTLSFIGLFQLGLLCVPFHIYWNIYLLCALIHILDFIVHFWINIVLFRIFHYKVKDFGKTWTFLCFI